MPQVRVRVERQVLMSRAEIDHLDAMLIPILSKRIAASHAVIVEKRAAGLPVARHRLITSADDARSTRHFGVAVFV